VHYGNLIQRVLDCTVTISFGVYLLLCLNCCVMCGCFGNLCTFFTVFCVIVLCFLIFSLCIVIVICFFYTSVRTASIECKFESPN
jgi:hypothetical protein